MADPEDTRRLILSRRARFLRLALGGAGVTAGLQGCSPCLSAVPSDRPLPEVTIPSASADAPGTSALGPGGELDAGVPASCLSVAASAEPDGSAPWPRPCLSIRPPKSPPPQICLSDDSVPGTP
jgi:hypothetical protein